MTEYAAYWEGGGGSHHAPEGKHSYAKIREETAFFEKHIFLEKYGAYAKGRWED